MSAVKKKARELVERLPEQATWDDLLRASENVEKLIGAVDRLEKFPRLGRAVPEAGEQESIREVVYRDYRLLYQVEDKGLLVLTILHGSRTLEGSEPIPWEIV